MNVDPSLPLQSLGYWLRFVGGVLVVLVLPGYIWVGRHQAGRSLPVRGLWSLAAGLLLVPPLGGPLSCAGPWLQASIYVPVASALGWFAGRSSPWRDWPRHLAPPATPRDLPAVALVLGGVAAMGHIIVKGWGATTVPLGDAANHVFLTWRVGEVGSLLPAQIFAPPVGSAGFTYLPGWHAAAAMISQVSGVPPWIVTWQLPVALLVLLPAACWLLWRECGFTTVTAAVASLMLGCFHYFAFEIFTWGGLGHLVGWFLVPFLVSAFLAVSRARSVLAGLTAVAAFTSFLTIHATEMVPVALLTAAGLGTAGRDGARSAGRAWLACGLALLVVVVGGLATVGKTYGVTGGHHVDLAEHLRVRWEGLRSAPLPWLFVRCCLVPGAVLGLCTRRTRAFVLAALVLLGTQLWLMGSPDRVIMLLTRPVYQEWPRLQYQWLYFVPAWIAAALVAGWQRAWLPARGRRWAGPWLRWPLAAGILVYLLWAAPEPPLQKFRSLDKFAAFGPADLAQAQRFAQILPGNALVANVVHDGSQWAMHVSRRRFYLPSTWMLANPGEPMRRNSVLAMAKQPWSADVLALQTLGVTHLYVSDTYEYLYYQPPADSGFDRAALRSSPFLKVVDDGEHATLFAIDWTAANAAAR